MTRDELREKVANELSDLFLGSQELRGFYEDAADAAIDTIFAALKEPTGESLCAGSKSDVLSSAIIDWQGNYVSEEEVASDVWWLMLSASPLAPKE